MTTGSENSALGDAGDKNNVPSYCKTRRGLCYPLVLFCFVCFHISSESGIYLTDQGPGVMTVGFCLVVFFFFLSLLFLFWAFALRSPMGLFALLVDRLLLFFLSDRLTICPRLHCYQSGRLYCTGFSTAKVFSELSRIRPFSHVYSFILGRAAKAKAKPPKNHI